jgi:ATP-dependent Clp protease ATP-binding subunit ClpA
MPNAEPANFFAWHYKVALPKLASHQLKKIVQAGYYFNFAGLLKNLFAPYRRMTLDKPDGDLIEQFFSRLSFNVISRVIGIIIRLFLIIGGFILFILIAAFYLATIPAYAILPFLSISKYVNWQNRYVSNKDLLSGENFYRKLLKNQMFKTISLYFDDNFQLIFRNVDLKPLEITAGTPVRETLLKIAKNSPRLNVYLEQNHLKTADFETLISTVLEIIAPPIHSGIIPLGETLSYGYTNTLDKYSIDLTRQDLPTAHINLDLLGKIEMVLSRPTDNNVLLIGEPGVGRHTTLNMLASAIQKRMLPDLAGKKVMLLNTVLLVGTGQDLSHSKSALQEIIYEAIHAGNIILAIDQLDRIAGNDRVDLSEVLIQSLKPQLPVIAISSLDDFNEFIRSNASLVKLFEKIDIEESSPVQTLAILIEKAYEEYRLAGIKTYLTSLLEIIRGSNKLLAQRQQPEKSIVLFNDIYGDAKHNKKPVITPPDVDKIISGLTPIPVGDIGKSEGTLLKNLEGSLHKFIIGQDEAVVQVSRAMRRSRAELSNEDRPIGSFLFLGPTGVGKTETAKVLAHTYFGSSKNMIRLDMSEFQDSDAIKKLIGDPTSKTPGILSSKVRQNPFSVLLLDEFEKANTAANNLFLQILDEGYATDALGKKVSFSNTIIIATSNAGAEYIREQTHQGKTVTGKQLMDFVLEKDLFSPELINRFDGVVVYHPLTQDQIVKVTMLMLKELSRKLKETKNITLEIKPELAQKIADASFDPEFGARPIRRYIQDHIEDEIAKMILDKKVKNGDKIEATDLTH